MKDSQQEDSDKDSANKYIKANNERFSTDEERKKSDFKYIKANNERFSTGCAHLVVAY